jgi:hypothetical protein
VSVDRDLEEDEAMRDPVIRVCLKVRQLQSLQQLAQEQHKSMAEVVRDLIEQAAPQGRKVDHDGENPPS